MRKIEIRNAAADEMMFFLSLAENEGWNPGLFDARPFYQTDPKGFFLATLKGEKIGCISAVRYNQDYGFLGFYIVSPPFRGRGFGIQLWNQAISYLGDRCIGLDGVVEQQENYKRSHFRLYYNNIRFKGEHAGKTSADVKPYTRDLFARVCQYDAKIFGLERSGFLEEWLKMPEAATFVKETEGAISGYGTIRRCKAGYKIGPLFADSVADAEDLLTCLSSQARGEPYFFDVPEENRKAMALAELMGMQEVFKTARMYTKTPPEQDLSRIYGVTSFELG